MTESVILIEKIIVKKVFLYFLTIATLFTASSNAMADSLVSNGSGGNSNGDYRYELWQTTDNTSYYLKIWKTETKAQEKQFFTTQHFESSRKALDYFDCNYAGKSLPVCPKP